MINNKGPSFEPCGTPWSIEQSSNDVPFRATYCYLPDKYDLIEPTIIYDFKLLPKFSDLINFDDCIVNITSKSIRLYPVFIQKQILIQP